MEPKILIVDDDPIILMSLDFLMRKQGHSVWLARNGSEAKQLFDEVAPDAVLLDVMMPDVDGITLCAAFKMERPTCKVVLISAKSAPESVAEGLQAGADRYVSKPFSTRKLVAELRELLEQ